MRRGEAWKVLRDRGGWMRMSERTIFYALLERSDNADCSVPANMTPSLVQLAESCCCSEASVKRALNHLERHGWVTRARVRNAGRGHKTGYQLAPGLTCPPFCPDHKGAHGEPLYDEKGAHGEPQKGAHSHRENTRSIAVSDEGIHEGEDREGVVKRDPWALWRGTPDFGPQVDDAYWRDPDRLGREHDDADSQWSTFGVLGKVSGW